MKRLQIDRRAVSPVIAAVLMIMVAIIGMSILFAFFVNYARDFQLGSGSAVLESFVIEDVWIQESATVGTADVELWVYNVGKAEINVTSVYVDNVLVAQMDPSVGIGVGKHEKLEFTFSTMDDVLYTFRVVTMRGSAVEGRYY